MVLMSFRRTMELSSAVDSAVGDNGRGEGGPDTSVDICASLCDNGKERSQEVNVQDHRD
jgi:hypothetical protein